MRTRDNETSGDLGDIVVMLLAGTMAGLRDRLVEDGFEDAADFVAALVEASDEYLTGRVAGSPRLSVVPRWD